MAQEKLGGMGWLLIILAGYAILQKKGVAQGFTPTQAQLSQASLLPTTPPVGSDALTASIQASLNRLIGANLAVDGVMGPRTRAAVMQFQTIWGIPATGIVDAETDYDIRAALGESPYVDQPYTSGAIIVSGEY